MAVSVAYAITRESVGDEIMVSVLDGAVELNFGGKPERMTPDEARDLALSLNRLLRRKPTRAKAADKKPNQPVEQAIPAG